MWREFYDSHVNYDRYYVLGAQTNHLIVMVLLSNHNMCFD